MTRKLVVAAAIVTLGMLLSSCREDYKNTPFAVMLLKEKKAAEPETEETARPPESASPTSGRKPAVLFVAYVATPPDVIDRMLKLAKVTKDDVVYDLGCGDGRIVVMAAKEYGCRAVGYDLDPLRIKEAQENVRKDGVAHLVTLEQQDILKTDFQSASVVTLYLGREMNVRLIPQLRRLRPGTRIVSHDFGVGKIRPDKVVKMTSRDDGRKHTLYLWTCPLAASNN